METIDFSALEARLRDFGIARVGYADLQGLLPERYGAFTGGISLIYRLCSGVWDEVRELQRPTYTYFHHYRTVNAALDQAALRAAVELERAGYRAMPIPASQSVHDGGPYAGAFPHKTAAVRAGLGWIGKSDLFVSPDFGPRVRLATVLTDAPLPDARREVSRSRCGSCRLCAEACPAHAITGADPTPGCSRSELFDPEACSRYMKTAYQQIGRGAVCGLCAAVCPFGRSEARKGASR